MFHVNEANDGKGILTVENGKMTIHVSMPSKNIENLFPGTAKEAKKDGAALLNPTADTVTYSDGMTEEVYGFDIPVPVLDKEFDVALIGTKKTWYDHKVSVLNPVRTEPDGSYQADVTLEGGSGRAGVESPAAVKVENGQAYATVVWSSPNYDYMMVDGEKYLNENAGKAGQNSAFIIPVAEFGEKIPVTADTTAMSTPHEIEYTLSFELIK